jgi:hypothetical protein
MRWSSKPRTPPHRHHEYGASARRRRARSRSPFDHQIGTSSRYAVIISWPSPWAFKTPLRESWPFPISQRRY